MSIQVVKVPTCRHTLTTGRRCKSAAVRPSAFCYHHANLRRTRPRTIGIPALQLYPNPLRDAHSIQHALGLVFEGLASGRLPTRHAGRMIYVLQLAIADQKRRTKSVS